MINPFFKNNGPFKISDILQLINLDDFEITNDQKINDIKDLFTSKKNDISFFHSKKYKDIAKNTKASFCITTESLKDELPKKCIPLVVENVLVSTSKVTSKSYPSSISDNFDYTARDIIETFCSIIVLCPIKQLDPRVTLSPIKTFFPKLTLSLNFVSTISLADKSKLSLIELG